MENLTKTELLDDSLKAGTTASSLLSDSWNWVKEHKTEAAVAGTAVLALGLYGGARALGARFGATAESKALAAGTSELATSLESAMAAGQHGFDAKAIQLGGSLDLAQVRLPIGAAKPVIKTLVIEGAETRGSQSIENALNSRAFEPLPSIQSKALGAIELGGPLDPAMLNMVERGGVKMVTVGPIENGVAENAFDHAALAPREPLLIKLPEGFDPKIALAERAAALQKLATAEQIHPISIAWGNGAG